MYCLDALQRYYTDLYNLSTIALQDQHKKSYLWIIALSFTIGDIHETSDYRRLLNTFEVGLYSS